jgi:predicted metal-dependent hydrolase
MKMTISEKQHRALGLVKDAALRANIEGLLPDYDFDWGLELRGAINRAAELRPSMLLIDINDEESNWREIVVALRSNPATRRIPMLALTAEMSDHATQIAASADIYGPLPVDALKKRLPDWASRRARVWDEDYYGALASRCDDPLPELAKKGIALFDAHDFWNAHETLEEAWIAVRPHPIGEVYRSILQVGVAYYQIERQNYRGAIKMFLRAIQWLDPLPDVCQGVDIAQFKKDAAASRAALVAWPMRRISRNWANCRRWAS